MFTLSQASQTSDYRQKLIDDALELAIREDLGEHRQDITTSAIVRDDKIVSGSVYCKEEAVVAGLRMFEYVLKKFDPQITIVPKVSDGQYIDSSPRVIATFSGSPTSILMGERLALNLLQRMSGIATITRQYVELAKPFGIAIRDTRKTTPGLRAIEREAVAIGGGQNHRFGLFDAILIKDNHIQIAGDIKTAIELTRACYPNLPIEVEATSIDQVEKAIEIGVAAILLDNMSPLMIRHSVSVVNGRCFVEVSGGVNFKNIKNYLIEGVNAISIGALTHSAPNVDISLEVEI